MIEEGRRNKEIFLEFTASAESAKRGIRQGFHRLGFLLVKRNRKLIRKGPKTGRYYSVKGRSRRHRASSKGQPPANLFGNLARSINYKILGNNMVFGSRGNERGGQVQPNNGVSYGAWLDGGTKSIKPRPHLSRTVKEFENTANNILNDYVYEAIK